MEKEKFRVFELSALIKQIKADSQTLSLEYRESVETRTERFSGEDQAAYEELLRSLKAHVLRELNSFFTVRRESKALTFSRTIEGFEDGGRGIEGRMAELREKIERGFISLKKKEQKKSELMEHMVDTFFVNKQNKKIFQYLKKYSEKKKYKKQMMEEMRAKYKQQVLKKAFLPWRAVGYKEGYGTTIRRTTDADLESIHEQYRGIIELLNTKIRETEDLIKIKKAAKGEFAYALNRDLLKTISNLSMEVISLNQVVLKDQNVDRAQTNAFMEDINRLLSSKFEKVASYRKVMVDEDGEEPQSKPKSKGKAISFAVK